jgi:hexosaminidase
MKRKICILFVLFCAVNLCAQDNLSALMPMPNNITQGKGIYHAKRSTLYTNSSSLDFAASQLSAIWKEYFHEEKPTVSFTKARTKLIVNPQMGNRERYVLDVSTKGITIKGTTAAAVCHGVMTLWQILLGDVSHTKRGEIACIHIDDTPRFGYRALMLDPARNFLPLKDVKFYIDQMIRYKYNVLQIHLTDNEGWRIEIKKYPQLTKNGPFYTQEEMKDLIDYAAKRNVEIVPELDIPGHTAAFLAAFPELACTQWKDSVFAPGKYNDCMVCMSKPETYNIYRDIINEVAKLFPSKRIHLGGDEAALNHNWSKCELCLATMKAKGYTKPSQLMNDFFAPILEATSKAGKKAILWTELDNLYPPFSSYLFDYPKDVTLVTWRAKNTPTCLDYTYRSGNDIIMAPGEYAYLDYPQLKGDLPEFNNWGMPLLTLTECYKFDPGYNLPPEQQKHILGVMGTLWGEAMKDINRVCYMTFPRGLALSEAGWTQMKNRSWESFKQRMYPNLMWLMEHGVSVRAPFEIAPRTDNNN